MEFRVKIIFDKFKEQKSQLMSDMDYVGARYFLNCRSCRKVRHRASIILFSFFFSLIMLILVEND